MHIINIEIKDNHEEALIAGKAMLELCEAVRSLSTLYLQDRLLISRLYYQLENARDLDVEIGDILEQQENRHPHQLLHAVSYY